MLHCCQYVLSLDVCIVHRKNNTEENSKISRFLFEKNGYKMFITFKGYLVIKNGVETPMKYTSSEAAKLIRRLQQDKVLLEREETAKSIFKAATIENPEDLRPEYSYEDTAKASEELDTKIRKIKHAINVFNTVTEVPGTGMTIDQVLVYLPQLAQRARILNGMSSRLPKRRAEGFEVTNKNVIDYVYTNYDVDKAKEDYNKIQDEIAKIQTALDLVNSQETLEIDI